MHTVDRHTHIQLGQQIGNRGGEGCVYEVLDRPDVVAKVYHDKRSFEKLQEQVKPKWLAYEDLQRICAWPTKVIYKNGEPVGFLMPKSSGKSIHLLYRPVDRKDHFPSATWQDLVHVSRNLAAAFHTLHHRSVLMADVNETNVLITEKGEVRFIDCDSFQVRSDDGTTYCCGVGTHLWTPPELQGCDLSSVLRTEQHDRFGLAVLIFHILFVGRHPFAGVPKTKAGIENPPGLEECIFRKQFPFSRRQRSDHSIPPGIPTLEALPESLADLFENAFLTASRPSPEQWYQELSAITFQKCRWGHVFFRRLSECPWCSIWNSGGPNFFVVALPTGQLAGGLAAEIERLILEIEQVAAPVLNDVSQSLASILLSEIPTYRREDFPIPACSPTPFPSAAAKMRPAFIFGWLLVFAAVAAAIAVPAGIVMWVIGGLIGFGMISGGSSNPKHAAETIRRNDALTKARAEYDARISGIEHRGSLVESEFNRKKDHAIQEIRIHQQSVRDVFLVHQERIASQLKSILTDIRGLGDRERLMINSRRQSSQKEDFLKRHRIGSHKITQIGPARTALLSQYGIDTAWDVLHMRVTVPRLGQGEVHLKWWAQKVEGRFAYRPHEPISDAMKQEIRRDLASFEQGLVDRYQGARLRWNELLLDNETNRLRHVRDSRLAELKRDLEQFNRKAVSDTSALAEELRKLARDLGQRIADATLCRE